MSTDAEIDKSVAQPIDLELKGLNVADPLRASSSFMKVAAAMFHYGNQPLTAGQIVNCVRELDLLPLRGETPRSTIQGIVSHSRSISRNINESDPFQIYKDSIQRQTKYRLSDALIGNAVPPEPKEISEGPVVVIPIGSPSLISYTGKRQRKAPDVYKPDEPKYAPKQKKTTKSKKAKHKVVRARARATATATATATAAIQSMDITEPEIDVERKTPSIEELMQVPIYKDDSDDEKDDTASPDSMELGSDYGDLSNTAVQVKTPPKPKLQPQPQPQPQPLLQPQPQPQPQPEVIVEDTIANYSLIYTPPPADLDYIDRINFTQYNIASNFAIAQQKGYSYPRFRSHEKIKIPKVHCEDKFSVSDISKNKRVVGRLFILADGHGGPGCSEYFVRNTPKAIQAMCLKYTLSKLADRAVQSKLENDIKRTIQGLDDDYLALKRQQIAEAKHTNEIVDNDGCTLILNLFLGDWLINVNIGDSRSVLITAPEPTAELPFTTPYTIGVDKDYNFDVEFASQDHKPYLEHLARHILENGGEFVDSVQNRVIKVDVEKLREDGNRHAKRVALKNARIRPKNYHPRLDPSAPIAGNSHGRNGGIDDHVRDRVPSLNVARSCGDLDFKMDSAHKIISCEPDVTFIRISDSRRGVRTTVRSGPNNEKRRHFLFMSTDGTFDYMYEETPDRQNKAIAKVLGPMIEDGEKIGHYLLDEEDKIRQDFLANSKKPAIIPRKQDFPPAVKQEEVSSLEEDTQIDIMNGGPSPIVMNQGSPMSIDDVSFEEEQEPPPPSPLLHKELDDDELKIRRIKERTLVCSARYFANREGAHGFFASKLQDYDDCTIVLVEI